ncbi:hypothetical protein BKA62DRAFT_624677 [Auriculariales sp. MPI-PUGE-AT-0066]|nr:hypothetical protein BKA62DRAFT_624677 [Auriculariales sp. MPI-PUGE-AT-0066]
MDHSQGVAYDRCGHYVPTHFYDKVDCGNRFCALSSRHNPACKPPNCDCDHDWDPDHGQIVVGHLAEACSNCRAYFDAAPPR